MRDREHSQCVKTEDLGRAGGISDWAKAPSMCAQSYCLLRPPKPQEGTVRKSSAQVKKLVTMIPRDCLVIDKLHLTPSDSALTVAGYA